MGRPKCRRTWKVGFFTKMCIRSPRHNGPHVSGDGFVSYDGITDGGVYNSMVDLEGPLIDDEPGEEDEVVKQQPKDEDRKDHGSILSPYR